jgi:hypothetical protein
MIEDLCCCGVIFFILAVIFFWVFGRAIVFRAPPRNQPPPTYNPQPMQPAPEQPRPGDIIMTRCQYCGRAYDESLQACPGCGGK